MRDDCRTTRRRLLGAGGLAGAAGLSGCLGFELFDGGTSVDAPGEIVTGWAWNEPARALDSTDERYEDQADATVDVSIEQVDHETLVDDLRSALVAGSGGPDFSILEGIDAPQFVETGGLADLSARTDDDLQDEFVDGAWETFTSGDAVHALPWDVGPVGVFYRRDVYEEHGIDADSIETWDEFREAGTNLPDGVAMINLPPNDLDGVWRRGFRQLGGRPFTEDGRVDVHSEPSLRVARTIGRLADAGITDDVESWGSDWYDAHEDGSIASLVAGPWMEPILVETMEDTTGEWGVYALPAYEPGGNRATNWGGSGLCIPAHAESADQAWDFVQWTLRSPDVQNAMYEEFGLFPALETAYDADYYDEAVEFFGDQRARRVFARLAPDIPGYRYTVDTPVVSREMNSALRGMVAGERSPEEAVQRAAERIAEETDRELA